MEPINTVKFRVVGTTKQGRKFLLQDTFKTISSAEEEAEWYREYANKNESHNWTGEFVVAIERTTYEYFKSNTEHRREPQQPKGTNDNG